MNKDKDIKIGAAIRELREEARMSAIELCRKASFDPRTLTAIEKGRIKNPSFQSLQKIAQGLGCFVTDLVSRAETKQEKNYHLGSQKGVYQMEFPKYGLKVVSATPPTPHFFCGKLILAPQRQVPREFFKKPTPLFAEVVMGKIEFQVDEAAVLLKEGENLFLHGASHWSFKNPLNRESAILLVTAPSLFHR